MKLIRFSSFILLFLCVAAIPVAAQTAHDDNRFPAIRFLDFQYEQFSPADYTSRLHGEVMEKGTLNSRKRFKAALNLPLYTKERFTLSSSWRYKYESWGFTGIENLLLNEMRLNHGNHEDFHFFSGALNITYRSRLFHKNIVYHASLTTDGSQEGFERINSSLLMLLTLKKDEKTSLSVGTMLNTSPTAIFYIIPIFSFGYKLHDTWMLDLMVPRYGYIRKEVSLNSRLSVGIRYDDELLFIYPDQPGFTKPHTYVHHEIKAELMYEQHLSRSLILTLRGGGANVLRERITAKNSSYRPIKVSTDMNLFLSVGVGYNPVRR